MHPRRIQSEPQKPQRSFLNDSALPYTESTIQGRDAPMIDARFAARRAGITPAGSGVATALPPFDNFEHACDAVVARLRADTGLALWAVMRVDDNDLVVLASDDENYGLRPGMHLRWSDTLCARMARDEGPQAVPDVLAEPHYRDAPILKQTAIRAYVGVPLQHGHGKLFGTLCGFDPAPRGPELAHCLPQVRLHARLLGTLLKHDLQLAETAHRAERAELESLVDPLTGAYNRRGWMRLLKTEEARCRRRDTSAGVLMADLDNLKLINDTLGHDAGDALLVRAARALARAVRDSDTVARVGGDEFAILAVGVAAEELDGLCIRADKALREAQVEATLGTALRSSNQTLEQAYHAADLAMLQLKQGKRTRLPGNPAQIPFDPDRQ